MGNNFYFIKFVLRLRWMCMKLYILLRDFSGFNHCQFEHTSWCKMIFIIWCMVEMCAMESSNSNDISRNRAARAGGMHFERVGTFSPYVCCWCCFPTIFPCLYEFSFICVYACVCVFFVLSLNGMMCIVRLSNQLFERE